MMGTALDCYRTLAETAGRIAEVGGGMRAGPGLSPRAGWAAVEPRGALWAHASSVGELGGVAAFEGALRSAEPGARVRVTCHTRTGLAAARDRLRLPASLAPWDAPFAVRRYLDRTRPAALLIFETELWPVLLALSVRRVPVAWVNGRIGARTRAAAWRLRPLLRDALAEVRAFAVQTGTDAAGFESLGARAGAIRVVGNLKHDRPAPAPISRSGLGLAGSGPVVVFGSLREGEEAAAVESWAAARRGNPELCAVFAPRKPEFVPPLLVRLRAAEVEFGLRSAGARDCRVLVLDTLGELAAGYGLADVAFVGGSLVPAGGHDVMEAARAGVPVLFGPHTGNCREDAEALIARGAAIRVADGAGLARDLGELLAHPSRRAAMSAAAREVSEASRGAARRAVEWLRERGALPATAGGMGP